MTFSDEIIRIRTDDPHADAARNPAPTIWSELRRIRRSSGVDVADVAQQAGLSVTTVESIEAGAIERLPIGEAGRKEVVRLCDVLGANPDPYLEAMRERATGPRLGRKLERQRPQRRRSRIVVFGLVWALVAVGFLIAWLTRGEEPTALEPSSETVATTVPTTQTLPTTSTTTAPPPPADAPPAAGSFTIQLVAARDDVWVQATVDGQKVKAGLVRRGETENWNGAEVVLVVGRPSAVDMTVNGESVPADENMRFP